MSVPNINAIAGLSIPNLGIISPSMNDNTSSTFITAATSTSLTNVLPLQARPNITRMTANTSFDPSELIDSAGKAIVNYFSSDPHKTENLRKELDVLVTNYSESINKYNLSYNALRDLQQQQQPSLEEVSSHMAQIEAHLDSFCKAAKAVRTSADALIRKTETHQLQRYRAHGHIRYTEISPFTKIHNGARAALTATENIDAFRSQELQTCQNGFLDQHINEFSPFYTEFVDLLSKMQNPASSGEEIANANAKLGELKEVLGQRIRGIIEFEGNEKLQTNSDWSSLQNDIDIAANNAHSYAEAHREMLATFDIETFQWDKAKKDLLSLPNERADDRKLKIAASQYKLYSFGLDAGRYVFSHCLKPALKEKFKGKWGEQAIELVDNGLQLAAEPLIKEFVCTQLLDYPDVFSAATQGNGFAPFVSGVSFACTAAKMGMKPTLDFFVKDQASRKWWKESIERPISVMLDVTGTTARALLPFQMGAGSLTASSLAGNFVVILAPPALSMFENFMGDKVGHDFRAVLRTANKVAADLTPVSLLCQGGEIASSYAKGALVKYGAEQLGTTLIGSTLFKGATWLARPVVFIPAVIAFRTLFDYPNMRTATLLEEIKKQHASNNLRKVEELRQEAQNWLVGNSQAVSKYNDCLGFFRFVPNRTTISENDRLELDRFLPKVNDALTSLVPIDTSSGIRSNLLYHKVAYFLSIDHPNNYAKAKIILENEKIDPHLYAQLIYFIVQHADSLASQNFDSADRFLHGAKEIFRDPAYSQIVEKYKEYLAVRRRNPQLTIDSSYNEIYAWLQAIDVVRRRVNQIPELAQFNESLQSNMANQYLALKRYSDVAGLFNTFGYLDLEAKYRTAQDFLQRDLNQTPSEATCQQMSRLLPNVDQTLDSLKPISQFSEVRRDLLFRKVVFLLSLDNPENYEKAKTILANEARDDELYARLIYFIVSRADSLAGQNLDNAERFLERSKNIFPTSAHNDVVAKYKAYIAQKRNPRLTAASTVDEINAWLRAIDNVRLSVNPIPELAPFNEHLQSDMVNQFLNLNRYQDIANLLGTFRDTDAATKYGAIQDFFRHDPIQPASPAALTRMRGLVPNVAQALEALNPIKKYSAVRHDLLYRNLAFLLSSNQSAEARRFLSTGASDPQLYHRIADFIVRRAEVLASTNLDTAEQFINGVREIFPSPAHNSIIEKYKDHIAVRKRTPRLTVANTENEINAWSQSIEEVRSRVSQIQELAPLKECLQQEMFNQYLDLKRYDDLANLLGRCDNTDVSAKYRATRGFLQQDPTQSPTDATFVQMNQLILPVDRALTSLLPKDSYSAIRRELLYRKVTFFLSGNDDRDYDWAKTFLRDERIDPQLYDGLIDFIIKKAGTLAQQNFDKAEHFLEKTREIFRDAAYNNIVAKYKEYVALRKRIPQLTPTTTENEINAWLQSIEEVKASVSQMRELAWVGESLQRTLVNQLLSLQKYDKVADLLVRFGDADLGAKYRSVDDFLRHDSIQTPSEATRLRLNGLLINVEQALEALRPLKHYEIVRRDLLYRKMAALLSVDDLRNYAAAKTILSSEEQSPELYAQLAYFMINRANSFAPENFDSAQRFLEKSKDIFPTPTYKNIIATYKEYRSCIKNNDRALPQITDDLIDQIVRIKEMSWLHEHLLVSKFERYVHARQYTQAKTTLALPQISESARARATKWLPHHLIDKGEKLLASNSAEKVYRELHTVASDCGMLDDSTVKSYLQALVHRFKSC